MNINMVPGYDGSCHAMSSKAASKVKKEGHVKERAFAKRIGGDVTKSALKKPDVIKDEYRYSMKGAVKNIQMLLLSFGKSENAYGSDNPMYKYQLAAYNHKKFKFDNNKMIDTKLLSKFLSAADDVAEWLRNKNNFRFVLEKVLTDDYDANKLVILKEKDQDALVYDMREVVDLWVNSNYKIHVSDGTKKSPNSGGKVVVSIIIGSKVLKNGKIKDIPRQIFYLETRGDEGKIGSLNHGCRAPEFYSFLQENLTYEIIPK